MELNFNWLSGFMWGVILGIFGMMGIIELLKGAAII